MGLTEAGDGASGALAPLPNAFDERLPAEVVAGPALGVDQSLHHHLSGYARMDLRLSDTGEVYVLEANANPNIEYGEDFAESAERSGIEYSALIQRILSLGLRYKAAWMVG